MNQFIKILSALGMIFAGIGQMLTQYNEIMAKTDVPDKVLDNNNGAINNKIND